jgi:hypothetical protein
MAKNSNYIFEYGGISRAVELPAQLVKGQSIPELVMVDFVMVNFVMVDFVMVTRDNVDRYLK